MPFALTLGAPFPPHCSLLAGVVGAEDPLLTVEGTSPVRPLATSGPSLGPHPLQL
jgi:hypothetical protein